MVDLDATRHGGVRIALRDIRPKRLYGTPLLDALIAHLKSNLENGPWLYVDSSGKRPHPRAGHLELVESRRRSELTGRGAENGAVKLDRRTADYLAKLLKLFAGNALRLALEVGYRLVDRRGHVECDGRSLRRPGLAPARPPTPSCRT